MRKSALFAGTFDPPTFGHLNVIERAAQFFDELIVGIANNTKKERPLLSVEKRSRLLQKLTAKWDHVHVTVFKGLTADFLDAHKIRYLVRSLRSASDCDFELCMARANRHLGDIETWFLPADERYLFISSSLVREIALNGGSLKAFVPPIVEKELQKAASKTPDCAPNP